MPSPGTLYTEGQTDEALSCLQMTENLAGKKVKTSDKNRVAQMVKNLLAMWETRIQSLGWKDPLEKEMATHASILAWRIPWREEPGGLQPMASQNSRT